jgi:hypothetical protein
VKAKDRSAVRCVIASVAGRRGATVGTLRDVRHEPRGCRVSRSDADIVLRLSGCKCRDRSLGKVETSVGMISAGKGLMSGVSAVVCRAVMWWKRAGSVASRPWMSSWALMSSRRRPQSRGAVGVLPQGGHPAGEPPRLADYDGLKIGREGDQPTRTMQWMSERSFVGTAAHMCICMSLAAKDKCMFWCPHMYTGQGNSHSMCLQ